MYKNSLTFVITENLHARLSVGVVGRLELELSDACNR